VEAALMSARVAPGLLRSGAWPLQSWPDFDGALWQAARREAVTAAEAQRRLLAASPELRPRLFGCDVHAGALGLAEHAVRQSRMDQEGYGWISLTHADLRDWTPPAQPQLVVTNPPWGGRLQGDDAEGEPVEETWFALGTFLKRRCAGARTAVLCGNREAATKLFLPQKHRHPVTVGGIDCRLLLMQMLPPKGAFI
jgi:putative N6-adenine-specific DNA methylase